MSKKQKATSSIDCPENEILNHLDLLTKYFKPNRTLKKPVAFSNNNFDFEPARAFSLGNPSILVVGDHEGTNDEIAQLLNKLGVHVAVCSISSCFDLYQFDENNSTIVWLDLSAVKSFESLAWLRKIEKQFSSIPLIVYDNIKRKEVEQEIILNFAWIYLKSLDDEEFISNCIRIALRFKHLLVENGMIKQSLSFPHSVFGVTGESSVSVKIREEIEKVAMLETPVVLQGEYGTKKIFVAQEIHSASMRAKYPFDFIAMETIPSECLSIYFFGCSANFHPLFPNGLFGKLELTHRGTLFLHQIHLLQLQEQKQLVEFLKNKTFRRFGSDRTIYADVRIIVSYYADLLKEVELGTFDEELYDLLHISEIHVPPIRNMKEDMRKSFEVAVTWAALVNNLPVPAIDQSAYDKIVAYSWPGNTFEFETVAKRAVLSDKDGVIRDDDIHFGRELHGYHNLSLKLGLGGMSMDEIQKQAIIETLDICGGNKHQAAKMLGISERTLYNKMNNFCID